MGVFRTHPEEDVKSFISNRRNESRFPERAEHCYTSGGSSRRAAALIGFMSGDVYWSPSIGCGDLRERQEEREGKKTRKRGEKVAKEVGEEEGRSAKRRRRNQNILSPSLPPSFPLSPTPASKTMVHSLPWSKA